MPPKKIPLTSPPPVTIATLRTVLTHIGAATSGTKPVLLSRLSKALRGAPPSFNASTCSSSSSSPSSKGTDCKSNARRDGSVKGKSEKSVRVLSIDMGIRNLAFCVADVEFPGRGTIASSPSTSGSSDKGEERGLDSVEMHIQAWRKLDVAREIGKTTNAGDLMAINGASDDIGMEEEEEERDVAAAYTPSTMARTAYTLLSRTLLPYNPDVILIERQRWRSGGGAAIQQWTVRVNTLEGMLWAILTALREESQVSRTSRTSTTHKADKSITPSHGDSDSERPPQQERNYEIHAIDPKRVAHFWLDSPPSSPSSSPTSSETTNSPSTRASGTTSRKKAEKKAKIARLQQFFFHSTNTDQSQPESPISTTTTQPLDLGLPSTNLAFAFSPPAHETKEALRPNVTPTSRGKGKKKKKKKGEKGADEKADGEEATSKAKLNKLDDVTDCFLQAAAWVCWEGNRAGVRRGVEGGGVEWLGRVLDGGGSSDGKVEVVAAKVKKGRGRKKVKEETDE
ncbi:ribonuclease H-like protein [Aaosphaeria arxii CBS 175.79]|uniref:Ribonuclease H-like protein n=1 Tax=Aaosphaeria arxii CBS 175.79 TaxID=1450172 RepID=A0A6A5XLH9_9PLEO|nr:ribonuclease H-like protein [Aaosphaeria arxii CBS 175.79]KAF2013709.1 ribonuclease H-like protein [Aaosphaeria arxii CBS 175.79]